MSIDLGRWVSRHFLEPLGWALAWGWAPGTHPRSHRGRWHLVKLRINEIAQPICWRSSPGRLGGMRYLAKFTDGKWRRVSKQRIIANAYD